MEITTELSNLQKANDCIMAPRYCGGPPALFDEFWREGELALMFGPAGAGKSVLAMQIADALARGREMEGFLMAYGRRKVLYVDLSLSDRQFGERYSYHSPNARSPKRYKFAENLYRGRPPRADDLCEWLEAAARGNGFDAVIIDDLSAIKRTHDGIRETLAVMRRLKNLCDERGIAILAIAGCDTPRPGRAVSERDLGRSRVLCGVADSVFALGPGGGQRGEQRLVQLRVRNATIFWKERNAPAGCVERLESGLLGFRFDERFDPYIDDATLDMIRRIRAMRKTGKAFKAIAAELGVSKTRAFNLNNKWLPAMGEREEEVGDEIDDGAAVSPPRQAAKDAARHPALDKEGSRVGELRGAESGLRIYEEPRNADTEISVEEEQAGESPAVEREFFDIGPTPRNPQSAIRNPQSNHGPHRISVYDLRRGLDGYGREIFIQSVEEHSGKPRVWYLFDRHGNKLRCERDSTGIYTRHLDKSRYV